MYALLSITRVLRFCFRRVQIVQCTFLFQKLLFNNVIDGYPVA